MLKNAMETASVLSKGLHRYETFQRDSKTCAECQRIRAVAALAVEQGGP